MKLCQINEAGVVVKQEINSANHCVIYKNSAFFYIPADYIDENSDV